MFEKTFKYRTPMKKMLISLLLVFIYFNSIAQDVDVNWGKEEKITRNSGSPEILGVIGDEIFVLKSDDTKDLGDYKIAVHDRKSFDQKKVYALETLLSKEVNKNDLEEIFIFHERIIIISSNKTELMATTIDLKGKLINPRILLSRVDTKEKGFSGYEISTSPDNSKLLAIRKIDDRDKEKASYTFMLYDTELKKISNSKQVMPYDGEHFTFGDALLTNSGDVYFSGTILIDGAKRKFNTYKSEMFMLNMGQTKPTLTNIPFPLKDKVYSSVRFSITENSINLVGLYAKSKTSEFLEGIFQLSLSREGFNVSNSTYLPFLKGLSSRTGTDDELDYGVSFNYKIDHIIPMESGEKHVVLSSENSLLRASGNSVTKVVYSADIIVMKISKENTIVYNTMVYKNQFYNIPYSQSYGVGGVGPVGFSYQKSVYRTYKKYEDLLSYAMLFDGEKINFVFNDHIKNMHTKMADNRFNSTNKSYCALVIFDTKTGKWVKKALFKAKDEETLMLPKTYVQVSDSEIITFAFKDGRSQSLGNVFINK